MRALKAPTLLVCLAGFCMAGEWESAIQKGTEAFHRRALSDALAAFEESWPLCSTPLEKAITASDIAEVLQAERKRAEAMPWFERAVAIWRTLPDRNAELAETALELVDLHRAAANFTTAETMLRGLLELSLPHERMAELLNTLGDLLREQVRRDEARTNFEKALALNGVSPTRQIESWLGLADIERAAGNTAASVDQWNKALSLSRDSGSTAGEALSLRGLGLTWTLAGDLTRAEPVLRRSLAAFEREQPPQPRQVAAAHTCLGQLYFQQGKLSLARQSWEYALGIELQNSGPRHPQAAVIMESLARIHSAQGRFEEAHDLSSQALDIMTASFGAASVPAATALATVALVNQKQKRLESAASDYASALTTMRSLGATTEQIFLVAMQNYESVLRALHRSREAGQVAAEIKSFRFH